MLLAGLTGGIGSGKTTVGKMFADLGAIVFDADDLAREVVRSGTRGYAAVVELFGSDVLLPSGELDRAALAGRVFSDNVERRELESVLHPEIFRALRERLGPLRKTERIVIFEAVLLIESGFDEECDMVISVEAPEELRLSRALAQSLRSEEDVRSRMAAQVSEEIRAARSDAVISNEGTQEGLREQVEQIWFELQSRNERVSGGV